MEELVGDGRQLNVSLPGELGEADTADAGGDVKIRVGCAHRQPQHALHSPPQGPVKGAQHPLGQHPQAETVGQEGDDESPHRVQLLPRRQSGLEPGVAVRTIKRGDKASSKAYNLASLFCGNHVVKVYSHSKSTAPFVEATYTLIYELFSLADLTSARVFLASPAVVITHMLERTQPCEMRMVWRRGGSHPDDARKACSPFPK